MLEVLRADFVYQHDCTAVWVAIWPDGNAFMGYIMLAGAIVLAVVFIQRVIFI